MIITLCLNYLVSLSADVIILLDIRGSANNIRRLTSIRIPDIEIGQSCKHVILAIKFPTLEDDILVLKWCQVPHIIPWLIYVCCRGDRKYEYPYDIYPQWTKIQAYIKLYDSTYIVSKCIAIIKLWDYVNHMIHHPGVKSLNRVCCTLNHMNVNIF